ncbi:MAG: hypothetical protein NTZ60_04425 [Campylobacterales bacterium]|nr:hypothetical protein [Campylobacterales bacterium]
MTKIKIIGVLIFFLSILLTFLSIYISQENKTNTDLLNTINIQKAFTQEISKNIFYIYKNKDVSTQQLDDSIKKFLLNTGNKDKIFMKINSSSIEKQTDKITLLWNEFYHFVQNFRDQSKVNTSYSNIILEQTVKDIYNTNLQLVVEFEYLIKLHQLYFSDTQEMNKNIQYILFFFLVTLLIYLFSQIKDVISFMQKFLDTSKKIIKNSSIKELKPIKIDNNNVHIIQATNNFNFLIDKINNSVQYSSDSIQHSYQSLESVEKNIEDLIELLNIIEEDENIDKELTKKEDAVIQSLEELTVSAYKLKNLKKDLDNLISNRIIK